MTFRYVNIDTVEELKTMKQHEEKLCIIDTLVPSATIQSLNNQHLNVDIPENAVALTQSASDFFNVRQLSIEEAIELTGNKVEDIVKTIKAVKKKNFNLLLIGFGGSGTSFDYWGRKLVELAKEEDVFNIVFAFDDDELDTTNMPRIPFSITKNETKKVKHFPSSEVRFNSNEENEGESHSVFDMEKAIGLVDSKTAKKIFSKEALEKYADIIYPEEDGNKTDQLAHKTIAYGAPDIADREWIGKIMPFYSATHRDNRCSLVMNPTGEAELMVETYGKINVGTFALNQLSMVIEFFKDIAKKSKDTRKWDKTQQNVFSQDLDKVEDIVTDSSVYRLSQLTEYNETQFRLKKRKEVK